MAHAMTDPVEDAQEAVTQVLNCLNESRELFRDDQEMKAAFSLDDAKYHAERALVLLAERDALDGVEASGLAEREPDDDGGDFYDGFGDWADSDPEPEPDGEGAPDGGDAPDDDRAPQSRDATNITRPWYDTERDDETKNELPGYERSSGSQRRLHPGSRVHQTLWLVHWYIIKKQVDANGGDLPEDHDDLAYIDNATFQEAFGDLFPNDRAAKTAVYEAKRMGVLEGDGRAFRTSMEGVRYLTEYGKPQDAMPDTDYPVPDECTEIEA